MTKFDSVYFDSPSVESVNTPPWLKFVYGTFTFLMQIAILFYHIFSFGALSNQQRLLWVISYSALQFVVGWELSIQLSITIPWIIFEIIVLLSIMKMKEDQQDHIVLLLAEINAYIWIVYGRDLVISILLPLICEYMIATANTKFNAFQLRSGLTYCITKLFARTYVIIIKKWSSRIFGVYALIPLAMVMLCQNYQLHGKFFWILYWTFYVAFLVYIIYS